MDGLLRAAERDWAASKDEPTHAKLMQVLRQTDVLGPGLVLDVRAPTELSSEWVEGKENLGVLVSERYEDYGLWLRNERRAREGYPFFYGVWTRGGELALRGCYRARSRFPRPMGTVTLGKDFATTLESIIGYWKGIRETLGMYLVSGSAPYAIVQRFHAPGQRTLSRSYVGGDTIPPETEGKTLLSPFNDVHTRYRGGHPVRHEAEHDGHRFTFYRDCIGVLQDDSNRAYLWRETLAPLLSFLRWIPEGPKESWQRLQGYVADD